RDLKSVKLLYVKVQKSDIWRKRNKQKLQYLYQLNIYQSIFGACSSQKQDYTYSKKTTGKGCTLKVVKNITRIPKVNKAPHLLNIIYILKQNQKSIKSVDLFSKQLKFKQKSFKI
ncbi:hypothetical protein pb186bvf_020951, partial [Paramecium bursaria]